MKSIQKTVGCWHKIRQRSGRGPYIPKGQLSGRRGTRKSGWKQGYTLNTETVYCERAGPRGQDPGGRKVAACLRSLVKASCLRSHGNSWNMLRSRKKYFYKPAVLSGTWVRRRSGLPHLNLAARHNGKESACQCRRHRFNPRVRKIPWRREWQPTLVFLSRDPWTEEPGELRVRYD